MQQATINQKTIADIIKAHKRLIKFSLAACARCTLCAESCFFFHQHKGDPRYMPSHKVINSIGLLYKKRGRITHEDLAGIKEIVWKRCALCTRCYCPIGIDIPRLIALARRICRAAGVVHTWDTPPTTVEPRQTGTEKPVHLTT